MDDYYDLFLLFVCVCPARTTLNCITFNIKEMDMKQRVLFGLDGLHREGFRLGIIKGELFLCSVAIVFNLRKGGIECVSQYIHCLCYINLIIYFPVSI